MSTSNAANKLYFGDNLDILREHVADESVDLIYLDSLFVSQAAFRRAPRRQRPLGEQKRMI